MNETFYTYLHGPRTFWGNSGSNIRINNNFGFPCIPPMMPSGYCCGGNNSLSIMMMMNSMMQQALPYWNFSKSEGAGSSDSTQTSLTTDRFSSTRQSMDQLGYTQAAGYGLYLDENGNVIYHYNKDGKDITATSMAELTSKIASTKSEGAGGSGSTESLEDSIVAPSETATSDSSVATDSTDSTGSAEESGEASDTDSSAQATKSSKRKYSRGDVGKGFEWTTMSNLSDNELKTKINDKGCKTVIGLMKILFPSYFEGKTDAYIKGSQYYKLLMNANPSAIDDNGNIVNKNKLDIVVKKEASAQTQPPQKPERCKMDVVKSTNSYLYKVNGATIGYFYNGDHGLKMEKGKLKGSWIFRLSDGHKLNAGDCKYGPRGPFYNTKRLIHTNFDDPNVSLSRLQRVGQGAPAYYDLKYDPACDGAILINLKQNNHDNWVPLEDAMRMELN